MRRFESRKENKRGIKSKCGRASSERKKKRKKKKKKKKRVFSPRLLLGCSDSSNVASIGEYCGRGNVQITRTEGFFPKGVDR